MSEPDRGVLHGSCVAHAGRGVLILGPSGSGKSGLALAMIALGARLVADDRTLVRPGPGAPLAETPAAIAGLIEARGVGLLRLVPVGPVPLAWAVDLARPEPARLPERREMQLAGQAVPLLWGAGVPNLAAALMVLLGAERIET